MSFSAPFLFLLLPGLLRVLLPFLSHVLCLGVWLLLGVCAMGRYPPVWVPFSAFVSLALLLFEYCTVSLGLGAVLMVFPLVSLVVFLS